MTYKTYFPRRGDVINFDASPSAGHEMAGRHYGLVLSPGEYNNKSGMAVILICTSKKKDYPYVLAFPPGLIPRTQANATGGSFLLCDSVRQIDWRERGTALVAKAPREFVEEALDMLLTLLDEEAMQGHEQRRLFRARVSDWIGQARPDAKG
jgi:mRNA interferase MazF